MGGKPAKPMADGVLYGIVINAPEEVAGLLMVPLSKRGDHSCGSPEYDFVPSSATGC